MVISHGNVMGRVSLLGTATAVETVRPVSIQEIVVNRVVADWRKICQQTDSRSTPGFRPVITFYVVVSDYDVIAIAAVDTVLVSLRIGAQAMNI